MNKPYKYIARFGLAIIAILIMGTIIPKVKIDIDQPTASAESPTETTFDEIYGKDFYKVKDGSVTCYVIKSGYGASGGISCLEIRG